MTQLMAKYPIAAFVCYGRLFHLIPHDGKQLLSVVPVETICDLDVEEEDQLPRR